MARFKDVDLDRLASDATDPSNALPLTGNDRFYLGSYPFNLRHFATLRFDGGTADSDRFWQAVILVYSWMGWGKLTTFQDPVKRYQNVCALLCNVAQEGVIAESDLETLSNTICQGSVIAASKLLHFLKPDCFAIWDTRVARSAYFSSNYNTINKPAVYLDYLKWLTSLKIDRQTISAVRGRIGQRSTSRLRVKEFILFMAVGDSSTRKRPSRSRIRHLLAD